VTLDDMYKETAMYVGETLQSQDGSYIGESIILINIFKSAINFAYKKIAREKYNLEFEDSVSSGDVLTKKFYKVKKVSVDNSPIDYQIENNAIEFDYDGYVDVLYYYIPNDLTNLTDVPELPDEAVDHKILCYYAAFQYFNIEDDDRAVKWLNMWEDGFNTINNNRVFQTQVKTVYDGGW
jgi:hypothetical protein